MERGGPSIAIDMPGWGRSDRPTPSASTTRCSGSRPSSSAASTSSASAERKLVVHDWGALALIGAQRRPELIEKLVVVNAVPLTARLPLALDRADLAPPPAGRDLQRATSRSGVALLMRQARGDRGPMPPRFID